jgi:hypothetical protein
MANWMPMVAHDPAALAVVCTFTAQLAAVTIAEIVDNPHRIAAAPGVVADRAAAVVRGVVVGVRVQWAGVAAFVSPPGHGAHRREVSA